MKTVASKARLLHSFRCTGSGDATDWPKPVVGQKVYIEGNGEGARVVPQ